MNFVRVPYNYVKSLSLLDGYEFDDRYVCNANGVVYLIKERFNNGYKAIAMKPFITRDGYVEYVLTTKHGTKKHIQGQRIVAGLYLDKPKGKDYVNHKDGNRSNNKVKNLEWVTVSENLKHSYSVLNRTPWNKKLVQ